MLKLKPKLIFFFVAVGAIFMVFFRDKLKKSDTDELLLRVAFPSSSEPTDYEPTKIHLAPQYLFLENIYSPIIENGDSGEVTAGVASDFEWDGNRAKLTIRNDLFTIDGYKITAEDVEFSLKRLLVLAGNTHGNFSSLICDGKVLLSVDENCKGILRNGNTILLTTDSVKPFLFPMLTAIDFAVIPKRSVNPNTLKINDYRNTSGPYYVETSSKEGGIVLKANPHHYSYHASMPQEIRLVPSESKDSFKLFEEGKVDLITAADLRLPNEQIDFGKLQSDAVTHETLKLRTFMAQFTHQNLKKFSEAQRFAFGKVLHENMGKVFQKSSGFELVSQFFPALGAGALNDNELSQVKRKVEEADVAAIKDVPLEVAVIRAGGRKLYEKNIQATLPLAKFKDYTEFSYQGSDFPDIEISGPDTGFIEDIGLLSYSVFYGMLSESAEEGTQWLDNYMLTQEKEKRLEMLRQQHFKVLSKGIIFPFARAPYVTIARKPWRLNLHTLYANTVFSRLRHE